MDSRSLYIVVLHAYVQFVLLVSKENVVKSAEALRTAAYMPLRKMLNALIAHIESLMEIIAKKDFDIQSLIFGIRMSEDSINYLNAENKAWRTRLSQRDRKITMLLRNEKSLIQQRDELQKEYAQYIELSNKIFWNNFRFVEIGKVIADNSELCKTELVALAKAIENNGGNAKATFLIAKAFDISIYRAFDSVYPKEINAE